VTRLQRLAAATLAVTVVLVAIGGFTRGTGSGFGCADRWPLCEGGALGGLLPRWDFHMIVEWTHRWFAAIAVVLVVAVVVTAWRRYRDDRGLLTGAVAALVVILAQAGLGAAVVITHLDADLVATHLTVAMVVLGLLACGTVQSAFAGGRRPVTSERAEPGWRWLLGIGAVGILATIVLGATVHDQYVAGWPLVDGQLVPAFDSTVVALHYAHRVAAAVTLVLLAWLAYGVIRRDRPRAETMLVHGGLALFLVNVGLGAAHVFTQVTVTGLVVAHILVASLAWIALVAALAVARHPRPRPPAGGAAAVRPPDAPPGAGWTPPRRSSRPKRPSP
jgi:heme a synthase